jgi:hypothetical protein
VTTHPHRGEVAGGIACLVILVGFVAYCAATAPSRDPELPREERIMRSGPAHRLRVVEYGATVAEYRTAGGVHWMQDTRLEFRDAATGNRVEINTGGATVLVEELKP